MGQLGAGSGQWEKCRPRRSPGWPQASMILGNVGRWAGVRELECGGRETLCVRDGREV